PVAAVSILHVQRDPQCYRCVRREQRHAAVLALGRADMRIDFRETFVIIQIEHDRGARNAERADSVTKRRLAHASRTDLRVRLHDKQQLVETLAYEMTD